MISQISSVVSWCTTHCKDCFVLGRGALTVGGVVLKLGEC